MDNYILPKRAKNLCGTRFGRLIAISPLPPLTPRDGCRWVCMCDCGNKTIVKARLLTYKKGTKSCGCIIVEFNRRKPKNRHSTNLKHGHSSRGVTTEYVSWSSMIQRCTNKKNNAYYKYGGRGINVCERWMNSFENFISDMGIKPTKNHSIDRIDNSLGYSPDNCRWATSVEQANNRSNSVLLIVFGCKILVSDASQKYNVPKRTLYRWIKEGRDVSQEITSRLAKTQLKASH